MPQRDSNHAHAAQKYAALGAAVGERKLPGNLAGTPERGTGDDRHTLVSGKWLYIMVVRAWEEPMISGAILCRKFCSS